MTAKLLTRPKESVLFPYWAVELGLEKLCSGNIRAIQVNFWAKNGEIFNIIPLCPSGPLHTLDDCSKQITVKLEKTNPSLFYESPIGKAVIIPLIFIATAMLTTKIILKKRKQPITPKIRKNLFFLPNNNARKKNY